MAAPVTASSCRFSSSVTLMDSPLDHIEWKLWRARTHTEEIYRICESFCKSDFYRLVTEVDGESFVVRFGEVEPFPGQVPLLVGEAAHHLRSALDHIAFALSQPATAGEEKAIQFPIVDKKEDFKTQIGNGRLRGASKAVIDFVESVQPYNTGNIPKASSLKRIRELNNWEKHRLPVVCAASFSTAIMNIRIVGGEGSIVDHELFRGRIETGAIAGRFKPSGYWTRGTEIYPEPQFELQPVFDDGAPSEIRGLNPNAVISDAGEFIQYELLPKFRDLL